MLENILSTVPENVLGPEMPFWLPAKHIPLVLQLDRVALVQNLGYLLLYLIGNFYLLLPAI